MRKKAYVAKEGLRRGVWTEQEDKLLSDYIESHGLERWRSLPENAGLNRCGKSCRLRWVNYLRPGIKRGNFSDEEEELVIRLHKLLGNRWSLIAGRMPGRTDNEIKNYWNSYLKKRAAMDVSESQYSSKTIQSTNNLSTSEDLNRNDSVIQEEHLAVQVEEDRRQEVCPLASDSSDFGFGLELSNNSVFFGYGKRDANRMAGSSVRGDVFNSKRMEGNEEMPPFIAEVEWDSLIKSCEQIQGLI